MRLLDLETKRRRLMLSVYRHPERKWFSGRIKNIKVRWIGPLFVWHLHK